MSNPMGAFWRQPSPSSARFATTRWTVVLAAATPDEPDAHDAFARLYSDYWPALYSFVRRRGHAPAVAEDITQDFFVALLEKRRLTGLTREGGRFRSFLLTALKRYLSNAWDRARTAKRGGGVTALPLEEAKAEALYQEVEGGSPEHCFDRQWALTVLGLARRRLEVELIETGKAAWVQTLGASLLSDPDQGDRTKQAAQLGLSEGALKVAVHRLRAHFGELLRQEIARTVDDPGDVSEELRYLIALVGRSG